MEQFLKKSTDGNKIELVIDTKIFSKDIILKAAYNFLDRGYFFFKYDKNSDILLQLTKKESSKEDLENIIADFSDELLSVYLRDKLEKDNKDIREKIVGAAIANSIDQSNFVSLNTDENREGDRNEIDFDKDIDEILKEIENDPELKIDEEEIERILKEIEEETANEERDKNITLDVNGVKNAKKKFQGDGKKNSKGKTK